MFPSKVVFHLVEVEPERDLVQAEEDTSVVEVQMVLVPNLCRP